MGAHFICDRCRDEGGHFDWCVCLRPASEQWKDHRTSDLSMFWRGRATALRILAERQKDSLSSVATLEAARIYEECADELFQTRTARCSTKK